MSIPSPTPRTDEEAFEDRGTGSKPEQFVYADFARTLERETTALRTELEGTRGELAIAKNELENNYFELDQIGAELAITKETLEARQKLAVHYETLYKQEQDELAAVNQASERMANEADAEVKGLRTELEEARKERDGALDQAKQARASRHAQETLSRDGFLKWKAQLDAALADSAAKQAEIERLTRERDEATDEATAAERLRWQNVSADFTRALEAKSKLAATVATQAARIAELEKRIRNTHGEWIAERAQPAPVSTDGAAEALPVPFVIPADGSTAW